MKVIVLSMFSFLLVINFSYARQVQIGPGGICSSAGKTLTINPEDPEKYLHYADGVVTGALHILKEEELDKEKIYVSFLRDMRMINKKESIQGSTVIFRDKGIAVGSFSLANRFILNNNETLKVYRGEIQHFLIMHLEKIHKITRSNFIKTGLAEGIKHYNKEMKELILEFFNKRFALEEAIDKSEDNAYYISINLALGVLDDMGYDGILDNTVCI